MRVRVLVVVVLLVLAGLVVGGVYLYQVYAASDGATPTVVPVASKPPTTSGVVTAQGTIEPRQQATLAFRLGGRVRQVRVKEGDQVTAGDLMVQLDDTQLRKQVAQAAAALDVAQKQLDQLRAGASDADRQAAKDAVTAAQAKYDDARSSGSNSAIKAAAAGLSEARSALARLDPSPQALAVAEAQVNLAQASLDAATTALDDARLTAPFTGTVAQVNVNIGDFVAPAVPVVIMGDISRLRVETEDVSDLDIARVKVGQPVNVKLDALPGQVVHGTVATISPMATESRGYKVFRVWIDLSQGIESGLRWGMTANVEIPIGAATGH